jgi:hypothetical protein
VADLNALALSLRAADYQHIRRPVSDQVSEQRGRDPETTALVIYRNATSANATLSSILDATPTHRIVHLAPVKKFDIAVANVFGLPREGYCIRFRAEAFNALNDVTFQPRRNLASTATFGTSPRT